MQLDLNAVLGVAGEAIFALAYGVPTTEGEGMEGEYGDL
jgi:hypothetical protein